MAQWAKIKFFWDTMLGADGSALIATSTESAADYDVDYLYNMMEINLWKAEDTGLADPQYITYDAGVGNSYDADYLAIIGHNLNTAGATVAIQYSATGAWAGEEVEVFSEAVSADTVYLKEFTAPGAKRYWRLKISGHGSAAPFMAICVWGEKTELDWASSSFDPYSQKVVAKSSLSYSGYLTGTHTRYIERSMSLRFADCDAALYDKVKNWWETHGTKNLFVAWDTTNSPEDVFLMRPSGRFSNPFNQTGLYRNISISLTGRRE
jgi:hypothetical protein